LLAEDLFGRTSQPTWRLSDTPTRLHPEGIAALRLKYLSNFLKAARDTEVKSFLSRTVFHISCLGRLGVSLFAWRWLYRRDKFLVLFGAFDNIFGTRRFLPAWVDLRTNFSSTFFGLPEQRYHLQMVNDFFKAHDIGQGV
jgi:hypothetical protein